jgi:hypothetical protein
MTVNDLVNRARNLANEAADQEAFLADRDAFISSLTLFLVSHAPDWFSSMQTDRRHEAVIERYHAKFAPRFNLDEDPHARLERVLRSVRR